MEHSLMGPLSLNVHPVYGAIYHDGEFVQRGAVMGLSVDSREVVVAPVSGWVRILADIPGRQGLCVEIRQQPAQDGSGSLSDD